MTYMYDLELYGEELDYVKFHPAIIKFDHHLSSSQLLFFTIILLLLQPAKTALLLPLLQPLLLLKPVSNSQ